MSSSKVYSYHELVKKILDYDSRFKIRHWERHPKIYHLDVTGTPLEKNKSVPKGYYKQIVRQFNLPSNFFLLTRSSGKNLRHRSQIPSSGNIC